MCNVDRPCGFSVVQHACLSAPLPRDSGASQALGTHFLYCGNLMEQSDQTLVAQRLTESVSSFLHPQ